GELAEYERLAHQVEATEESFHAALFGPRPAAEALVAEAAGRIVGYALFFTSFSTFLGRSGLYLEDLYVQSDQRGRGVGRQLLAALARLAVQRGCGRLEWAVLDWNQPSIEFYRRLGAVAMDEWTVYRLTGDALRSLGQ
ncbi:MAG TPA: GNAT family N-acetyltransferase, partial [Lacipirellulaceae bacterium]|nr:GNAT family N-acetyltransferase [Lacipirellulaceae bacterium]